LSNPKPDCPSCDDSKKVVEWLTKGDNNIWLCQRCTLTFNPDDPDEHKSSIQYQSLDCPKCGAALNYTTGRDYRHVSCPEDKCNYSTTFRDGKVDNQ
jgi:rubredoxin